MRGLPRRGIPPRTRRRKRRRLHRRAKRRPRLRCPPHLYRVSPRPHPRLLAERTLFPQSIVLRRLPPNPRHPRPHGARRRQLSMPSVPSVSRVSGRCGRELPYLRFSSRRPRRIGGQPLRALPHAPARTASAQGRAEKPFASNHTPRGDSRSLSNGHHTRAPQFLRGRERLSRSRVSELRPPA